MYKWRSAEVPSFRQKVLTLFTGSAVGQAIPILAAPIVARLYLPADFGIFGVYLGVVGLAAVVSTGRYELAILLPRNDKSAHSLLTLSLILVVSTAIVILVLLLALQLLVGIAQRNPMGYWILLIPVAVMLRGSIQSLVFLHTRLGNYRRIATARLSQGFALSIGQIVLGIMSFGSGGLIVGSALSYVVSLIVNAIGFTAGISLRNERAVATVLAASTRFKNFPKYNLPHATLRAATMNVPVLLLSLYFTDSEVGQYAMCYGTVVLPLSLVNQSIFQVFSSELSEKTRDDPTAALELARILRRKLVAIVAGPAIVAVVIAPTIFSFVLGEQWRQAGELFRWLSPMIIMSFISSNFSFIPQLAGRQRRALMLEIAGFLMMLGSIAIGGGSDNMKVALILFSFSAAALTAYRLSWYFSILRAKADMTVRDVSSEGPRNLLQ